MRRHGHTDTVPGPVAGAHASREAWLQGTHMLRTTSARQAQKLAHALQDGRVADAAAGDAEADAVRQRAQRRFLANGLHRGSQHVALMLCSLPALQALS